MYRLYTLYNWNLGDLRQCTIVSFDFTRGFATIDNIISLDIIIIYATELYYYILFYNGIVEKRSFLHCSLFIMSCHPCE